MNPEFLQCLINDGFPISKTSRYELLTGGVSSEIYKVYGDGNAVVVKRALKKLKVKADWFADVSRNSFEISYLKYVADFLPEAVPKVLGQGQDYFVMEYLGSEFLNWKFLLMSGNIQETHAQEAGKILGKVHRHSHNGEKAAKQFNAVKNFTQLRVAPYLLHCARKYPVMAPLLRQEAKRLQNTKECLVHGDFSPKNILISEKRMVVVDCEVANYGDAAFDIAFLLSHLLLKALYHAPEQTKLSHLAHAFLLAYGKERDTLIDYGELQQRTAILLPMLLLARVDGKSPVEYLNLDKQAFTRKFATQQILEQNFGLKPMIQTWFKTLRTASHLQGESGQ